ncbi:unnamed protein product [Lactuca virosa]|uniref:RING-type domain-containing protein n=1 Tax=Lactuca virosa TaxID=75947 RepID=A0AAU9PMC6_9ASTR|nr:unnamed protein product [Lactuca virosa]
MEFELFTDCAEDDYTFGAEDDDNEQEQLVFEGDEGQRCGICMDVVVDRGVLDCCQHWYCFSCIDNWSSITNLCPLCQSEFQLITCVPVYDTIGNVQLDDESYARDDDWSVEGNNNTLSFPSYYIDENAVSCLEGDSCKIRGQSNLEEDPDLDTSIACDSCDLWYHAICVGFDTDGSCENSWLCPRCLADEASKKSELGSSNTYEQLGDAAFPMNVSVSVADAGETAVVVSIIDGNQQTKVQDETMFSSINITKDLQIGNQENEEMNQIMLSDVCEDMGIDNTKVDIDDNHKLEKQLSEKIIKKPKLEPVEEDLPSSNFKEETSVSDELLSPDKKRKSGGNTGGKRKQRDFSGDEGETKVKKIVKTERSRVAHSVNEPHYSKRSNKAVAKKQRVETDIRDIVQGPYHKPSEDKGLRIKKIMRRAADDKESLMVVQNLRKEIREAVRNRSSKEIGDNLFDPKLLAAFRTALTGGQTETKRPPLPLNMKAKKALLQKGTTRENLTKKIYGVGGKRKRAWTRDCEIEFWKHRVSNVVSKPEKIQTLKSVLDLLRKGPEVIEVKKENIENAPGSILSRLYVADSSVFPRKADIKPLSALKSPDVIEASVKPTDSLVHGTKGKKVNLNKSSEKSSMNAQKESGNGSSDVKVDKRKWAMEVLARKTAVSGNNSTQGQDNVALKGNYPLLSKLPVEMRPSLATSRHNKIPISVRQAQLHRITEHFLKKTNMPITTRPTAEIELAVADAINIEKSVADRSNSKLVYVNLCSQELLHRSDNNNIDSEPKPTSVIADNSETTTTTTTTTSADVDADVDVNEALRNAGLLSDSPPGSPPVCEKMEEDDGPDNVFEIDDEQELDIYGDFEYDLEEENFIGVSDAIKKASKKLQDDDTKIKMVFSTLDSKRSDSGWRFEDHEEAPPVIMENTNEDKTNGEEDEVDECEELYGPDKEPLINKYPEIKPLDFVTENIVSQVNIEAKASDATNKPVEIVEAKDKKSHPDKKQQSEKHSSVFKKVEAYIKEHIRPLCKSGVITVDQYRWAVGKTTDKIMKFHSKDTNANFLIKEGEKVKKLAEQYVEAAQKLENNK